MNSSPLSTGKGGLKSSVAPVVRRNVADLAYEKLHRAIVEGTLAAGQRLSDAALANQLGISRAPVREAISRLESSGLVISKAGRGCSVVDFTDEDIEEIYSLRSSYEAFATERAAERITADQVSKLEHLLGEMEASSAAGAWRDVLTFDMQFHEEVVRAADHSRLLESWQLLRDQIILVAGLTARVLYRDLRDIRQRHVPIVKALKAQDQAAAAREARSHVLDVHELLVQRRASSLTATVSETQA